MNALGSIRNDIMGEGEARGVSGPAVLRDAPGMLRGRSLGRAPHPESVGSAMNVVHVFFLKILGIQP